MYNIQKHTKTKFTSSYNVETCLTECLEINVKRNSSIQTMTSSVPEGILLPGATPGEYRMGKVNTHCTLTLIIATYVCCQINDVPLGKASMSSMFALVSSHTCPTVGHHPSPSTSISLSFQLSNVHTHKHAHTHTHTHACTHARTQA